MGAVNIFNAAIRIIFRKRRVEDDETDNAFSQRYSRGN
jgi:hypothetical protein